MGKIRFILNGIAYGLAAALIIILANPQLRSNLGLNHLKDNVMRPSAMSFAYAVKEAAPAVVNWPARCDQRSWFRSHYDP